MTASTTIRNDRDFIDAAYHYDRAEHIGSKRFSVPAAASSFDYHFSKARSLMSSVASRHGMTYGEVLSEVRSYVREKLA